MNKIIYTLSLLFMLPICAYSGSYENLASRLVEAGNGLKGQKVVIVPFRTGNGLPETAGADAAHKLNIKLVQELFYDVVSAREFVSADTWVKENGDPGKNSALQLMERLNAQLAVTGELSRKSDTSVLIKTKLINTAAKKTIASVSEEVPNEWGTQTEPGYTTETSPAPASGTVGASYSRTENTVSPIDSYSRPSSDYSRDFKKRSEDYGFLDLFWGFMNNSELNMEFKNDVHNVNAADFTNGAITGSYSSFELKWADLKGTGPIGIRGGFFADMIGFDFGLQYHSYETKKQRVKTNLVIQNSYELPEKYAKMSIYEMNMDLLLRFIKSSVADVYAGFGIGMSIMNLELPYVKDSSNKATDEIALGMSFRIPLGARWKVTDSMHLVTEVSYDAATNMSDFDRGYMNEKDSFILSGTRALAGISFVF